MVKACQVEDRLFTNTGSEGAGGESFESRQCSSEWLEMPMRRVPAAVREGRRGRGHESSTR